MFLLSLVPSVSKLYFFVLSSIKYTYVIYNNYHPYIHRIWLWRGSLIICVAGLVKNIKRRKMSTLCYIVVFLKTSIECTTSKDFCTCHGRSLSSTLQIRWWKIGLETKFLRRISHIIEIYEIPTALFDSTEGIRPVLALCRYDTHQIYIYNPNIVLVSQNFIGLVSLRL